MVSLRKGSVDELEADPLDDFFLGIVVETLGADREETIFVG